MHAGRGRKGVGLGAIDHQAERAGAIEVPGVVFLFWVGGWVSWVGGGEVSGWVGKALAMSR